MSIANFKLSIFNRLDSTWLKIIALVIMTIDHIAAYDSGIFPFLPSELMRIVGRIATPLFMFALIQGARHTRSRRNYLLRLYIASLAIIAAWAVLFAGFGGYFSGKPTILSTFLYVLTYCFIGEKIREKLKAKSIAALLYIGLAAAVTVVPVVLDRTLGAAVASGISGNDFVLTEAVRAVYRTILPNIINVDYSPLFVLMGVIWCFAGNKYVCAGGLGFIQRIQLVRSPQKRCF